MVLNRLKCLALYNLRQIELEFNSYCQISFGLVTIISVDTSRPRAPQAHHVIQDHTTCPKTTPRDPDTKISGSHQKKFNRLQFWPEVNSLCLLSWRSKCELESSEITVSGYFREIFTEYTKCWSIFGLFFPTLLHHFKDLSWTSFGFG